MPVITASDPDNVVSNEEIVIVDFWAKWCSPCRAVEEVLRRVLRKLEASGRRVLLCKIDVGENPGVAAKYGVLGLPTVILFIKGREVLRHTGGPMGLERRILQALGMNSM